MTKKALRQVSLDDKYEVQQGRIFISGTQALTRIALIQRQLDKQQGLNTRGYISGYRGSPLGGLDMALWQQRERLKESDVVFQPGVNEDLAATAIWGTQQLDYFPDPEVDGVYSMWYGKGPGVDRSTDVLRHGNIAGSHKNGGVLVVAGDDHPGKSSTVVNQSEPLLASLNMPVLYPSNVAEIMEFGLLGWQLSRYSGLWVGLKTVNETVEQTETIEIDLENFKAILPAHDHGESVNISRTVFMPQNGEVLVKRIRLPLVHQFVRANGLDKTPWQGQGGLGIITAGKSYEDVLQAFNLLGLSQQDAEQMGIGIYKPGCIWPLEPQGLTEFAQARAELLVLEEKTPVMEPQIGTLLFNLEQRPKLSGKNSAEGNPILPSDIQYTPMMLIDAIVDRLKRQGPLPEGLAQRYQAVVDEFALVTANSKVQPAAMRMPYFCSGCPHNRSTKLPEGSLGMAGIGCHAMAAFKRPDTMLPTQMGGEGLNWTGAAPFSGTRHMFQNMGDGTYYHSGLMAIRGAIAAKVNITYKILFNDAVAMTGGQPVDGPLSVGDIIRQVQAEGVNKVALVSDQPELHRNSGDIPAGIEIHHRDDLMALQEQFRTLEGTTVILYEQTCAAEKRRRRKKGLFPNPAKRAVINPDVCENCGDCSVQSTCVSIQPTATALGVKRTIDQSSCNKDFSCVNGFCPSFVTVHGAEPKRPDAKGFDEKLLAAIPTPAVASVREGNHAIMIAGIGGTGVITVGAVIGMAAHLEGRHCSIYDMTGLSQKNGAVYSHLRIADNADAVSAQRIGTGEADLVLGFDLIAALTGDSGITFNPNKTDLLGNTDITTTSDFQFNRNFKIEDSVIRTQLKQRTQPERVHFIDASSLALELCGDTIAANMFMVGFAAQKGLLPVSLDAMLRAIELNGVAVAFNKQAFALGRLYAHQPEVIQAQRDSGSVATEPSLDDTIEHRTGLLTDYQSAAYAQRYRDTIARLRQAEADSGSVALTVAAAHNLAKLMAYKDEYEVARLHSSAKFKAQLEQQFEPGFQLKFHMAPPLLSRIDKQSGRPKKMEFGGWMMSVFKGLASLKGLRGTALDPFGYTEERRHERGLIKSYLADVEQAIAWLNAHPGQQPPQALVALLNLPDGIRGYGPVKASAMADASQQRDALLAQLN